MKVTLIHKPGSIIIEYTNGTLHDLNLKDYFGCPWALLCAKTIVRIIQNTLRCVDSPVLRQTFSRDDIFQSGGKSREKRGRSIGPSSRATGLTSVKNIINVAARR